MSKRKPRSRKAAAPSRAAGRRVGPLWWGAGLLALGWIAVDANRPFVERHVPQLADLRLPWDTRDAAPARRESVPQRAASRAVPARPAPSPSTSPGADVAERPAERRQAALRPASAPTPSAVPERRPAQPVPALTASSPRPSSSADRAPAATRSDLVTRTPMPLRRAPQAGAPVWMVLDAGRPLRVTRREGHFARVESGIFTGWVEAAALPPEAAAPAQRSSMPTLAAVGARRTGPVPAASVPGPTH